jgi:hypothetical protein
MEARPPALIDAAIRLLTPPACREHVLGDLWERYSSPRQYVADALRTLPYVVASQIRRTADPLWLLMQIVPVFVAFGGLRPALDGTGPSGWARAAAPTLSVTLALVLRDAYRNSARLSSRRALAMDSVVAMVCALLSQVAVAVVRPDLALAGWGLAGGSVASGVLLFFLRNARPPQTVFQLPIGADGRLAPDDLVRDIQKFEQRIRQRNRVEMSAGILVTFAFGAFLLRGPGLTLRVASGLAIAGALFITWYIRTKGAVRPIPTDVAQTVSMAAYRRELERQRDLLRTVTWWYLLPLLPGMATMTIGHALGGAHLASAMSVLGLFLVVALLTRQLNHQVASKLQHKIDALRALEAAE